MASERKFIKENMKRVMIKEFLLNRTQDAGFGGVTIQRTPLGTRVTLTVERPGMVIGRHGGLIKQLTEILETDFDLDNPQVEVQEARNPNNNAQIMAQKLAFALERGWHFRRGGHSTVRRIMEGGAKGCQVTLAGKLTGDRHRTEKFKQGHIKFCGEPALQWMQRGYAVAKKKSGVIGVTVRIMDPNALLPDIVEIHEPKPAVADAPAEGVVAPEGAPAEGAPDAEAPVEDAKPAKVTKTVEDAKPAKVTKRTRKKAAKAEAKAKAAAEAEAAPEEPAAEAPAEEPVEEAPAEEPAAEEPVEEVPAEEAPVEEPAAEEPVEEVPAEEAPVEEPAAEEPVEEVPAEEAPVEEPAAEEPVEETPAEEPAEETPAEEPVVEEPVAEEPTEKTPAEEPVGEAPAEEPVEEAPVEEPEAEDPVEEPPAEEPAAEEPVEEAPAEDAPAEEPAEEEPVTDDGSQSTDSTTEPETGDVSMEDQDVPAKGE